jgi:hypothetical protein
VPILNDSARIRFDQVSSSFCTSEAICYRFTNNWITVQDSNLGRARFSPDAFSPLSTASGPHLSTKVLAFVVPVVILIIYYYSSQNNGAVFDYTLRIARGLINGHLGDADKPSSRLTEMIPSDGRNYSAFPLGSVLTLIPVALLEELRVVRGFPGAALAGFTAGVTAGFLWLLSNMYQARIERRLLLTCFPLLGTWMWANLAFAGAWQIALGVAVAAQAGALYFTIGRFSPLIAGGCFALAFGNRTEIIVLAPLFYWLISRQVESATTDRRSTLSAFVGAAIRFSVVPLILGTATLAYNFARFGSVFDFGYARIPGVLQEPWYAHGIFSVHAIAGNAREMLLTTWKRIPEFPYLVPTGFGGSIFLNSPYLFFVFRTGSHDRALKRIAWVAVLVLTLVLWCHGNAGGWQFSYRYAMVLLPWIFLILLESSPERVSRVETALFSATVALNAYATYLFLWTSYMQP